MSSYWHQLKASWHALLDCICCDHDGAYSVVPVYMSDLTQNTIGFLKCPYAVDRKLFQNAERGVRGYAKAPIEIT